MFHRCVSFSFIHKSPPINFRSFDEYTLSMI
jgi:hypothetical protein